VYFAPPSYPVAALTHIIIRTGTAHSAGSVRSR
jgi:hypothetical protein